MGAGCRSRYESRERYDAAMTEGPETPPSAMPSEPPAETSSVERAMRFDPVHKVRSRPQPPTATDPVEHDPAGDPDMAVAPDGERPFTHIEDAPVGEADASPWARLRNHPRFGLMVAGTLVAAVVLAGGLAWSVQSGTEAPQKKAEEFLDYLAVEDYPRAQALFDADCSNDVTERTLAGIFNGYDFQHTMDTTEISGSGAVVTGVIEVAGVGEVPARVNLRRVGGDWFICGIGTR